MRIGDSANIGVLLTMYKQFRMSTPTTNGLKKILEHSYEILRRDKNNILLNFYVCEMIYDLSLKNKIDAYERSIFETLSKKLLGIELRELSKDAAILANYHHCLALIYKWSFELLVNSQPDDPEDPELTERICKKFYFLKMSREYCKLAERYAISTPVQRSFFSEKDLREVKRDSFIDEVAQLRGFLDNEGEHTELLRKQRIKSLFGKFAGQYQRHEESTNHVLAQTEVIRRLFPDLLKNDLEQHILDIGTGPGIIPSIIISEAYRVTKVIGIDTSKEMITAARKKQPSAKEHYLVCDIENAEQVRSVLNEQKFNVIIFSFVFAWLSDKQRALNNVKGLLHPGGKILILEEMFRDEKKHTPTFSGRRNTTTLLEELFKLADHMPLYDLIDKMNENGFKCTNDVLHRIDNMHDVKGLVFEDMRCPK